MIAIVIRLSYNIVVIAIVIRPEYHQDQELFSDSLNNDRHNSNNNNHNNEIINNDMNNNRHNSNNTNRNNNINKKKLSFVIIIDIIVTIMILTSSPDGVQGIYIYIYIYIYICIYTYIPTHIHTYE